MMIQLLKADYFELRARAGDCAAIQLDALRAANRFAELIREAEQRHAATLDALGKAHGFDPTQAVQWDDATYTLTTTDVVKGDDASRS